VRPRAEAIPKRRHPIPTGAFTMSRWAIGGDVRVGGMPSLRACGARPSRGGQSKLGWPSGENPGITRREVFPEGRTLCVRKSGPFIGRDTSFPTHPLTTAR
jgi:hypothetical protein